MHSQAHNQQNGSRVKELSERLEFGTDGIEGGLVPSLSCDSTSFSFLRAMGPATQEPCQPGIMRAPQGRHRPHQLLGSLFFERAFQMNSSTTSTSRAPPTPAPTPAPIATEEEEEEELLL
jgi:hypothetical protein